MIENTVSIQKQKNPVEVSVTHQLKLKPELSLIQSKAASYDNLIHILSRKRYDGSDIGKILFGTAASMVQHAGMNEVSTIAQ